MGEPSLPNLSFGSNRRFGVELEINAFDGRNRPADPHKNPAGTEEVVALIQENVQEGVVIRGYEHTHDNDYWVVKPDASCGLEVCSPILKGWRGIQKVCSVVEAFYRDQRVKADRRCSVHVHVELADLNEAQICSTLAYWVKTEPVFLDLVPAERKRNRYCQFVGCSNLFDVESSVSPKHLIDRLGESKYLTLNCNQMKKTQMGRKTIEFRIIEGAGSKDPYLIKNWIRLILHFVEMSAKMPFPNAYKEGDRWSSMCWLDPADLFEVLGFGMPPKYELSKGLVQTRNWAFSRLVKHCGDSDQFRTFASRQLSEMDAKFREHGIVIDPNESLSPTDLKDALYHDTSRF